MINLTKPAIQKYEAFLLANNDAYEYIVKKIQNLDIRSDKDAVLNHVSFVAKFAMIFHPGRFADGAIENIALGVGRILPDNEFLGLPTGTKMIHHRRILHVASQVQGIGGHSRMIYNWICNDQSSCHSLVILGQEDEPIPQWLSEAIRGRGGELLLLKKAGPCQKAQWLRDIARRWADLVVLHIDGYDVVPTVAFAVSECPPVVLVNHSDHHFWLGSSVADIVINLRTIGAIHTAERLFNSSNMILPIPLKDPVKKVSYQSARRMLEIPEDQVVLLSIGRAEKYRPCGPYDFVETVGKILDRQPAAHLYVVGESQAGILPYLRCAVHNRLHFVGIKEDPSIYRAAADVYLESFPFGSQTALLEAALNELPVVPAYDPLFSLLVANDDALQDILMNSKDENGYIKLAETLIKEPEQRIAQGKLLRERLLIDHAGEGWLNRLYTIYHKTDSLIHMPRSIPVSVCKMTSSDIGLSMWHIINDNKSYSGDDGDAVLLWHIVLLSRYVGDYVKAGRFGWRAMRLDPRGSWRIFAMVRGVVARFLRKISLLIKNKN